MGAVWDAVKGVFVDDSGKPDVTNIAGAGLAGLYGLSRIDDSDTLSKFFGGSSQPTGYQGGIPNYVATREAVPGAFADATRRPGEAGRRYFTDTKYTVNAGSPIMGKTAEQLAAENAQYLADQKRANEILGAITPGISALGNRRATTTATPYTTTSSPAGMTNQTGTTADAAWLEKSKSFGEPQWRKVIDTWAAQNPKATKAQIANALAMFGVPKTLTDYAYSKVPTALAQGGLTSLPKANGYYLGGQTDGMADEVPASIDGNQKAALSHGEFVFPADVVSHLGNGNSEAGAKVLYDMMDRVRKDRTGSTKQGRQINPTKYTPR